MVRFEAVPTANSGDELFAGHAGARQPARRLAGLFSARVPRRPAARLLLNLAAKSPPIRRANAWRAGFQQSLESFVGFGGGHARVSAHRGPSTASARRRFATSCPQRWPAGKPFASSDGAAAVEASMARDPATRPKPESLSDVVRALAGRNSSAASSANTALTLMPTSRNGSVSSQTMGYSTSARMASGQLEHEEQAPQQERDHGGLSGTGPTGLE